MKDRDESLVCLCSDDKFKELFVYDAPPTGETHFGLSPGRPYRRLLYQCQTCGHIRCVHEMELMDFYGHDYVTGTYGNREGIKKAFDRINALPASSSDNMGRVESVIDFTGNHWRKNSVHKGTGKVLDVGSGLCVFLYRMKERGWDCTALDTDPRLLEHAREAVGIRTILGDFMTLPNGQLYDLITFNKVLEHLKDPISMLRKSASHLTHKGFVYVEVPDGESAWVEGPNREEFFIEHFHAFSLSSVHSMTRRAGFEAEKMERLQEPSGKYTLRAFLTKGST